MGREQIHYYCTPTQLCTHHTHRQCATRDSCLQMSLIIAGFLFSTSDSMIWSDIYMPSIKPILVLCISRILSHLIKGTIELPQPITSLEFLKLVIASVSKIEMDL